VTGGRRAYTCGRVTIGRDARIAAFVRDGSRIGDRSTVYYPAHSSVTATAGVGIGAGAPTYISQFRRQFPALAEGKTDEQILRDGEADCSDMAAAGKLTTASMANRYSLSDSTADQFTLYNVGLLATFTLCGPR
jgi:hypothetical protein